MTPDTGIYNDVPSFILGCTREIWEDRGVGTKLARYYAQDCLVRAPTGLTTSMAGVAADTLATLHQFPDRELVGEDVIWDDCGDGSFLSSHRLISVMRHTGDGAFGAATGALVKSRIIADCWVKDGIITEEWLVRDGGAFAAALGMEARQLAERLVAEDVARFGKARYFCAADEQIRAYRPTLSSDPAAEIAAQAYREIWGAQTPSAIRSWYDEGAEVALPGQARANGWSEIDRFVISVLASMPDAVLTIHSSTVNRVSERPTRVSLRWSLDGTHIGWGRFDRPTGAPVHVMGMSHLHLTGNRIMAEWLLFDEVAIWKQIIAHQREAETPR